MRRAQVCFSGDLSLLLEPYDERKGGIAEPPGFRVLWRPGLTTNGSFGCRDANEASWSQPVDAVERIVDPTTEPPAFVDGDSSYGNLDNVKVLGTTAATVASVPLHDRQEGEI